MAESVDLNSDVGEGFGAWPGGPDARVMTIITSANVACGFHAGDPSIMRRTCEMAVENNVAIGAQVSYPDLAGFGRRFIDMRPGRAAPTPCSTNSARSTRSPRSPAPVAYVKPHGALYNTIVHHEAQAEAVVGAVHRVRPELPLLGLPGSAVLRARRGRPGCAFVAEGFADRGYTADGTLVPARASRARC